MTLNLRNFKVHMQDMLGDLTALFMEAQFICPTASEWIESAMSELDEALVEIEERLEDD